MSAQDYPVYFPYGATSAPYSTTNPHKGNDRCNAVGVPVVINGTQIGLTGFTGDVVPKNEKGAHLHIQEWHGGYANTRNPQNEFKGGVVTNIDPTGTQGDGSFGKFITIQTPDGWNDTYCHLSEIDVKIGDRIGEPMFNEGDAVNFNFYYYGKDNGQFRNYIDKDWKESAYGIAEEIKKQKLILTNEGDVPALNQATGRVDGATQVDKPWKDVTESYVFPNVNKNLKPYDGPTLYTEAK